MITGQLDEGGDDYFVVNFTNSGIGNSYWPEVLMSNDGGGLYRMQVMNPGCGSNVSACAGSLTDWYQLYNQYSDPTNCKAVGNCSDGTGRVTTVVVRVFRIAGGPTCTNYSITAFL